ncbi:MAG: phosphoglycerate kinase [Candidatus Dojkabacteria bacterium]|nr:phosphoglycerate kinase [Candidatus Dojkabacteria bacterium]MDQ7021232.1 phosphoglycerate kinase [Candidatus Dojkabacteria bacterium]
MAKQISELTKSDLKGKVVLIRANFDIKLDEDEQITDSSRIQSTVKTIEYLLDKNCKIVIASHLGKPKGEDVDTLSLMSIRFELGKLLSKPIKFAHIDACENSIKFMEEGEILLLENLKFKEEETSKSAAKRDEFISTLLRLTNVYVFEGFGLDETLASVNNFNKEDLVKTIGFNVKSEIEAAEEIKNGEDPKVFILGGELTELKLSVIDKMLDQLDKVLVGGPAAYTFLKAKGVKIGKSDYSKDLLDKTKKIIDKASKKDVEIILPVDHITVKELDEEAKAIDIDTQAIDKDLYGVDLGEKTLVMYREIIESANTLIWNGTMGKYEWENFNRGTESIGEFIALSASKKALKIAFGINTSTAISTLKIKRKRFSHISTDTKSFSELLLGKDLSILKNL